jgi:hypothetical protein
MVHMAIEEINIHNSTSNFTAQILKSPTGLREQGFRKLSFGSKEKNLCFTRLICFNELNTILNN